MNGCMQIPAEDSAGSSTLGREEKKVKQKVTNRLAALSTEHNPALNDGGRNGAAKFPSVKRRIMAL